MTPAALRKRLRDLKALQAKVANEIRDAEMRLMFAEQDTRPTMRGPRRYWPRSVRPPCGTERGYQWHRYHDPTGWPLPDDDPCRCRAAHREHRRMREALRREETAA